MITATAAVNMTMAHFVIGGGANANHFDFEMQVFTGQWMIHIHIRIELSDLHYGAWLNPVFSIDVDCLTRG